MTEPTPASAQAGIDLPITARAQALFASDLSAFRCHTPASVVAAMRRAIRVHGGVRGCLAEVAAAYGEYPETAAARMRWARIIAEHGAGGVAR